MESALDVISDEKVIRAKAAKAVFAFICCSLLVYYFSNTLLHQLRSPVIKHPYVDPTYWVLHLLQIPEKIFQSQFGALLFDFSLITIPLLIIFIQNRLSYLICFLRYMVCIF